MSWIAGQLDRVGLGSLLVLVSPTRGSQNNDLAVGAVVALFLGVSALQALVLRLPFLQSPRYVWYCKQHVKVLSFMDAVMLSDNSVAAILAAFKCATAEAFAGFSVNVALLVADDAEYGDEHGKDGDAADPSLLAAAGASVALHRVHEGTSSLSSRRDQAAAATAPVETCGTGAGAGEDGLLQTSGPLLSRAALGTSPRKRRQVRWLPLNALESLAYAISQRLIVFTNDYSTTSLLFQDWTVLYKSGAGAAMMVVPLVFNGRDLGALEIVSPRPDVFDEQMRRIAVEFSTQLGQALYNKLVEHEASVGNRLLLEIMPSAVAEQVKRQVLQRGLNDTQQTLSAGSSETIVYKHWHPQVSVLFADVLGYTRLSCEVEPEVVMLLLHVLFAKLDALCDQYGCYKVNTIGDCYIACTGLLVEVEDHAQQLVDFGKALLQACSEVDNPMGGKIEMRVGINSGRVMSGIVGKTRPHFTLYGDCVNTASRMESTGLPGTIQITEDTYMQLGEQERALWGERRSVQVKGKGAMRTYVFRNEAGAAALAEEEAAASTASPDTSAATIGNWDAYAEPEECDWQI
ncbi:hypothetical protein Vafri_10637 [Volvox africanus]|nr:hypothetical protein Vafri_10637 [Volvox africanus]